MEKRFRRLSGIASVAYRSRVPSCGLFKLKVVSVPESQFPNLIVARRSTPPPPPRLAWASEEENDAVDLPDAGRKGRERQRRLRQPISWADVTARSRSALRRALAATGSCPIGARAARTRGLESA